MDGPAARIAARLAIAIALAGCTPTASPSAPAPSAASPASAAPPAATPAPTPDETSPPPSAAPPATPAPPVASPPTAGTWARLEVDGDRPAPREDHTWTVAEDGRAYLFGGRDGAKVFDDLWSFDFGTERWEREFVGGPTPPGRFGHEAAWLEGSGILVWAGQAGDRFFDDVWLLDFEAGEWRRLETRGDAPVARYGSCSGIGPDGRLWVSHGFTANGVRFDDTRRLDGGSLRWTDQTPPGEGPVRRCLHACWWTSDGRLALYGGQTNGVPALGDLWFLAPGLVGAASHAWQAAPQQAAPARQLPAVARQGALTVIVGGRGTDGEALGDAWVVPDGATTLSPLEAGDGPPARSGAALVEDAARGRLVLFGGVGDEAFDDAWALTLG